MAKKLIVIYSNDNASQVYRTLGDPSEHDECAFLRDLNGKYLKLPGARTVSYTGDKKSGFKAVIEVEA